MQLAAKTSLAAEAPALRKAQHEVQNTIKSLRGAYQQLQVFRRETAWPATVEAGVFFVRWLQLLGLLHCVQEYGIDFSTTVGASMVPVFRSSGDVLLFERLTHRFSGWVRGEVIVATSPKDPDARICKRIMGLPGDRVKVTEGPYSSHEEVLVPRGHVWLEGDNKAASYDSRHYGPVPMGLLQGKVRAKLYPLNDFGWVKRLEQ